MVPMKFPPNVERFLSNICARSRGVWLIGSRANGTTKNTSDWDFVVFGDEELINRLTDLPPPEDIDALVVYDGDRFRCPWPRKSDGCIKRGSLSEWKWTPKSPTEVEYLAIKAGDDWDTERYARGILIQAREEATGDWS